MPSQLEHLVRGPVLRPRSAEYDVVRRVWNGMHDRRPLAIARCLDDIDVSRTIRYARDTGLPVTVRGGGHNVAGTSVADGALMIDLSFQRQTMVDPTRGLARVGGGCLLADLDNATAPHSLAFPTGVVSRTGVGGLTLGGGYGWLCRKWGLSCDHLVAATVVLADGQVVRTSAEEEPDLLWALRGGGGNFGVVTEFVLRLRPVAPVWWTTAVYQEPDIEAALQAYAEFAPHQPDDLQAVVCLRRAPDVAWLPERLRQTSVLTITAVWLGELAAGPTIIAPLLATPRPAASTAKVVSYPDLQAMGDDAEPPGQRYFTKSTYLRTLDRDVVRTLVAAAAANPSPLSVIDLNFFGGAVARVPPDATAFPGRTAGFLCAASAAWTRPDEDARHISWARDLIGALAPREGASTYLNYMPHSDSATVARIYGRGYQRLTGLKRRYDPSNLFRGNQNIAPDG